MSWRKKLDNKVQARTVSAVELSPLHVHMTKSHLSFSYHSGSEPEHPSSKTGVYEPVITDLDELLTSGERYRRVKR